MTYLPVGMGVSDISGCQFQLFFLNTISVCSLHQKTGLVLRHSFGCYRLCGTDQAITI